MQLIRPEWPAPANVRAASTTRGGGVSAAPFDSLNLGYHPRDERRNVAVNRRRLAQALALPGEPAWLRQVHGSRVLDAAAAAHAPAPADASVALQPATVCVVLTADCLPVLLCDRAGSRVAAVHAGWRGLAGGVIAAAVRALACEPGALLAWLGPAIGPRVYEVGPEVREAFLRLDAADGACFRPSPAGRWLADLYALARRQLAGLGVAGVYGGGWCTYSDAQRFFSYRRDGSSGRMASLIWLDQAGGTSR